MATIELKRLKRWGDKYRDYKIFLDDKEVGHISEGKVWTIDCPPGEHTLQLKVDWGKSPKIQFNVLPKEIDLRFECHNRGPAIFALFYVFMPSKLITLTRTE